MILWFVLLVSPQLSFSAIFEEYSGNLGHEFNQLNTIAEYESKINSHDGYENTVYFQPENTSPAYYDKSETEFSDQTLVSSSSSGFTEPIDIDVPMTPDPIWHITSSKFSYLQSDNDSKLDSFYPDSSTQTETIDDDSDQRARNFKHPENILSPKAIRRPFNRHSSEVSDYKNSLFTFNKIPKRHKKLMLGKIKIPDANGRVDKLSSVCKSPKTQKFSSIPTPKIFKGDSSKDPSSLFVSMSPSSESFTSNFEILGNDDRTPDLPSSREDVYMQYVNSIGERNKSETLRNLIDEYVI